MPSESDRKHKRKSEDKYEDHKHKKRRKDASDGRRKDKHKAITVVEDNPDEEEIWVETNIDVDGQNVRFTCISIPDC